MDSISKGKRAQYHPTKDDRRKALIHDVVIRGQKVKEVADRYQMKYSTAKTILRLYKIEGRIHKKKKRAPRKTKINVEPKQVINESLKILDFPRTLPLPEKLKQMQRSENYMWESIFIQKFE